MTIPVDDVAAGVRAVLSIPENGAATSPSEPPLRTRSRTSSRPERRQSARDALNTVETALRKLVLALPRLKAKAGGGERRETAPSVDEQEPWHALTAAQTAVHFGCAPHDGLSAEDVAERLHRYGANRLPEPEQRSGLSIFIDQLKSAPVALLAGSAVLSAATGGLLDAGAIVVVILANAAIGYVTESGAERTIRALERSEPPPVRVRRNGALCLVDSADVVPGDVIQLRRAIVVPADARLLSARALTVDESALTGESLPVEKDASAVERLDAPLAEQRNMVFRGTVTTGGEGEALVVATGSATQIGLIQHLLGAVERSETPLQEQLSRLGMQLVVGSSIICGGVFALGLLRGHNWMQMLKTSVSLAVAAIPEGLPTVAITTLALGIRRMEAHNVSVRHLGAVETLGAVQALCMDKTGTITENRMAVQAVAVAEQAFDVVQGGLVSRGNNGDAESGASLAWLLRIGVLCSEVTLSGKGEQTQFVGSPTECALVQFAVAQGLDVRVERRQNPLLGIHHRSEAVQVMATLHAGQDGNGRTWAVKGRPGDILARCRRRLIQGRVDVLDELAREEIDTQNERMTGRALRVLGMAFAPEASTEELPDELIWVGLVGIADPPRPGTKELLSRFHAAGIDTLMITGDQGGTAHAIAREVGLARDGRIEILDSLALERLEPEVLRTLVMRAHVFARVSPAHKLRVVQALQAAGRVVAMTGDGINDGPALKAAHVSVAMGSVGTEVARDVADVVLTDDRLESVLVAVELGRTIYDDIRKAVRFILATNLSEILLTAAQVALGRSEVLTPMQLLWINILTDVFPELALAVQPPESDVLQRPPRPAGEPMFKRRDMMRVGREGALIAGTALAAQAWAARRYGQGPEANTVAFMTLTSAQLLHAISARSEQHSIFGRNSLAPNPYLAATVGGALGLQVLAGLLPPLRRVLGTTRVAPSDWLVSAGFAVIPLVVNELLKLRRPGYAAERALPEPAG